MRKFQRGDWVRNKYAHHIISKIEEINSTEDEVLLENDMFIEIEHIEHWQPKSGEWCWFIDNGVPKYYIQIRQFESMDGIFFKPFGALRGYANCEPFIGCLPSILSDNR